MVDLSLATAVHLGWLEVVVEGLEVRREVVMESEILVSDTGRASPVVEHSLSASGSLRLEGVPVPEYVVPPLSSLSSV